jgi:hypothetical protein
MAVALLDVARYLARVSVPIPAERARPHALGRHWNGGSGAGSALKLRLQSCDQRFRRFAPSLFLGDPPEEVRLVGFRELGSSSRRRRW